MQDKSNQRQDKNFKISRSMEEVILIASAIMMAMTIIPFSIYRYFNGQYAIAMIELLSVMIMCGIGVYVWQTRDTKYTSSLTSVFMLSGLVTFNYLLGSSILFWIYPIIMTVYFLNSLKVSLILVTISMVALMPLLIREKTTIEVVSIVVTLIICQLFGFLLSKKIREQYTILEELANHDGLTGASNRRSLEERIHFLSNLSYRHNKRVESVASIIMFDIDDFKKINDNYGHMEGDNILIKLTQLVKNTIRGTDQLYRYGGEEFIIIANGADALEATEFAEKVRKTLEMSHISDLTSVTASFGVAQSQKRENPNRWLERADQAMYRAKRAGKNRVFIANHDPVKTSYENEALKIVEL